jgi:hypothetical protein
MFPINSTMMYVLQYERERQLELLARAGYVAPRRRRFRTRRRPALLSGPRAAAARMVLRTGDQLPPVAPAP